MPVRREAREHEKTPRHEALFGHVARRSPRSILVMRPGAMGDVLLTTPALKALRAGFPESHIAALVTPAGEAILRKNPDVDEVIVLDKSSLSSRAGIIGQVRRRRFDLVIDFLCNPRTALIAACSGARDRLGYDVRLRKLAYNLRKPRDEYRDGKKVVKYAAQVNVDMVTCLGVGGIDTQLRFEVSERAEEKIEGFLRRHSMGSGRVVGVCPAGSWPAKTWELGKFAELADRLIGEAGSRVIIIWGPGEERLAEEMAAAMRGRGVLACKTDIDEVGALLRRCSVFVSNDSGLKHIAVAVGTPTVTVFGPTNPVTWNAADPLHRAVHADVDCLFCDKNECESMVCMRKLEVSDVLPIVKELLEQVVPYEEDERSKK